LYTEKICGFCIRGNFRISNWSVVEGTLTKLRLMGQPNSVLRPSNQERPAFGLKVYDYVMSIWDHYLMWNSGSIYNIPLYPSKNAAARQYEAQNQLLQI